MPKTETRTGCLLWCLLFFFAASLGSCTYKPYHPVKTEQAWAVDHQACEKWAREGIRDEPDTYNDLDEMKMIKQCMRQKGWSWKRTGLLSVENQENQ